MSKITDSGTGLVFSVGGSMCLCYVVQNSEKLNFFANQTLFLGGMILILLGVGFFSLSLFADGGNE